MRENLWVRTSQIRFAISISESTCEFFERLLVLLHVWGSTVEIRLGRLCSGRLPVAIPQPPSTSRKFCRHAYTDMREQVLDWIAHTWGALAFRSTICSRPSAQLKDLPGFCSRSYFLSALHSPFAYFARAVTRFTDFWYFFKQSSLSNWSQA